MALILFKKSTPFMDKYLYSEGVTYEVPERLQVKFCNQMGVAVEIPEADAVDVQPNPSAEMYDGEDLVALKECTPAPVVEVEEEATEEVAEEAPDAPRYELKGRGGPWFVVVDTTTGKELPGKPLRKSDAEKLISELANQDTESPAE